MYRKGSTIDQHLQRLGSLIYDNCKDQTNSLNTGLFSQIAYHNNQFSVTIRKTQTHSNLMEYLHTAAFGPVKSSILKAIRKGCFKA